MMGDTQLKWKERKRLEKAAIVLVFFRTGFDFDFDFDFTMVLGPN
jgi:hypothetical protein